MYYAVPNPKKSGGASRRLIYTSKCPQKFPAALRAALHRVVNASKIPGGASRRRVHVWLAAVPGASALGALPSAVPEPLPWELCPDGAQPSQKSEI